MSPGISLEFSAEGTLTSFKCLNNLCDVFLIVMHQQYALSFAHGKIIVSYPVTLLCQWLVVTSILLHWFVSIGFLFQFSSLHLDCISASQQLDEMKKVMALAQAEIERLRQENQNPR